MSSSSLPIVLPLGLLRLFANTKTFCQTIVSRLSAVCPLPMGIVAVFLILAYATGATAQQTGSCLQNGGTCQWDTSLGNCCSTYCYQQVGQTTGVCRDRPGTAGAGATAQTATAYQTPQRNPATYTQNGIGIYGGGQAAASGQCIQNGQTCQWDTSMGNCCSTYCYQQQGQSTGICQDRPAGSQTAGQGNYQATAQYSAPAYSQPAGSYASATSQTACPGCYSGTSQASQPAYSGYSGQPGAAGSCLANGQTCTWSGSMGNCCSGWCQQLEPQPTGVCAQPAGTPGPSAAGYSSQTLQRNPSNVVPSSMTYSTGQVASQGGNCIANGQSCQWDTSMGNCCSTYCYQQQGQSTGICQDRPAGSQTAGQGNYQATAQYSAPAYSQPAATSQTACPGCYSGTSQASQPAYSGYFGQAARSSGCLATGQTCTWSGSMGNCCSGWCRQMENESTGTCSEKIYAQG